MASTNLTADRLRAVLDYNPETGVFTWKQRVSRKLPIGTVAGNMMRDGYIQLMLDGRNYAAHRLAWLYVYGEWPTNVIDHIDGKPFNNAISNLRDVTQGQNLENQKRARTNNKCGLLGVCRSTKGWRATIESRGKWIHIGTFETPEQAHAAYLSMKARLHINAPSPMA